MAILAYRPQHRGGERATHQGGHEDDGAAGLSVLGFVGHHLPYPLLHHGRRHCAGQQVVLLYLHRRRGAIPLLFLLCSLAHLRCHACHYPVQQSQDRRHTLLLRAVRPRQGGR